MVAATTTHHAAAPQSASAAATAGLHSPSAVLQELPPPPPQLALLPHGVAPAPGTGLLYVWFQLQVACPGVQAQHTEHHGCQCF